MSLDIGTIREALASQVRSALAVSTQPLNGYGYPPDSPELPALLVLPRSNEGQFVNPHATFGRTASAGGAVCQIALRLEVRCGGGQIDAATSMDKYLSFGNTESVFDALLDDVTLGAVIKTLRIEGVTQPAWYEPPEGGRTWLSVFIDLDIYAQR